ncbi:MAG: SRPBCC domain-containing protein [Candidatus Zixiibacteriota bacterium]
MAELLNEKVRQRTFIAAAPDEVFDTVTSATHWDKFFTTGMELDPKPGGVCSFSWKDWGPDEYTMKVPGKVLEIERPRLFSFQWGAEQRATTVRIELTAQDGGTVVTLEEGGYRDTSDGRAMILECASGWGEALTLLKFYIEHGITYRCERTTSRR